MSELVIETVGLRKEFRTRRGRHVVAVHDLDLAVPAGGVHGFLGPNGSGKTTTIRMLLGLARASAGQMRLFGQSVPHHLHDVMPRVGAVVEQPKFVPMFTGRNNLLLLAQSLGLPRRNVDAAIEQVGLPDPVAGAMALEGAGFRVTRDGDLLHVDGAANPADITRLLAGQGMFVHELTPVRQDLESVFLQLTADSTLSATDTVGVA